MALWAGNLSPGYVISILPTRCKNFPKETALDGGTWHTGLLTCGALHITSTQALLV